MIEVIVIKRGIIVVTFAQNRSQLEMSWDIKITVLTRAVSGSYPMALPLVVDIRRDVVFVGEFRVAPGPQAIFDCLVCRDYPPLTRKTCDVSRS